ncbi:MAG: hypothetical protein ABIF71_09760 [Planctomycetota bacterium]
MIRIACFTLCLGLLAGAVWAQNVPAAPAAPAAPAIKAGEATLRPVADTYVACYPVGDRAPNAKGSEQTANAGVTKRLKIKRHENSPLLKFDFAKVPAGATIDKAELIVTMTDPAMKLGNVCAWSLHVDWNEGQGIWDDGEGTETKANPDHDGACLIGPKGVNSRWREYDASDFAHAAFGNGGNAVGVLIARDLGQGRFAIAIDPYVVHAAIRDGSTIALTEETGHWETYADAFFFSHEAEKEKAPILKLEWKSGRDKTAPAFQGVLTAVTGPDPGSIVLTLPTAGDDGAEGTALGYDVTVDGKAVPRVLIPRPAAFHRGMLVTGLTPGKNVAVKVTAFDEAGNTAALTAAVDACPAFTAKLAAPVAKPALTPAPAVANAGFSVRVVDAITLYDPLSGALSPKQQRAQAGAIEFVPAVRGEIVGFQVLVALLGGARLDGIKVAFEDADGGELVPGATVEFYRAHYVQMDGTWFADILAPLAADETITLPSQNNLSGQRMVAIYADLIIPPGTAAGLYQGRVKVSSSTGEAAVPLAVQVADVVIPDTISFDLEMNTYGHSDKLETFLAVYRLCHKHRLAYNVLGYGHSRADSLTTPGIKGSGAGTKVTDWSKYDAFYGPVFSGEAAKGLPRDGVPAAHWYLPFHEGWPAKLSDTDPIKECWEGRVAPNADKKKYAEWVDRMCQFLKSPADHFSPVWRETNAAVVKQFIAHAKEKGWTKTQLQIFSNHKFYCASGSMSLWVMDEPQYGTDFRALDWMYGFYGDLFKDSGLNVALRADISRPSWGGSRFDRGLDLSVGYTDCNERFLIDRVKAQGISQWWYGGGRGADADPGMYAALFMNKWRQGCVGGMPNWLFDGGDKTWSSTDPLRYITYDPQGNPVPTVRMKACRYGQQIIDLANLLAAKPGYNRWRVADLLAAEFPVKIVIVSKGPEDPGYATIENLDAGTLERIRAMLIATLAK